MFIGAPVIYIKVIEDIYYEDLLIKMGYGSKYFSIKMGSTGRWLETHLDWDRVALDINYYPTFICLNDGGVDPTYIRSSDMVCVIKK